MEKRRFTGAVLWFWLPASEVSEIPCRPVRYHRNREDDWLLREKRDEEPDRKGIKREWCEKVLREPEHTEVEPNGRVRRWALIQEAGKYLRVVTLEDRETVHNAMFDRTYARKRRREGE